MTRWAALMICWATSTFAQGGWEELRRDGPLRVEARRSEVGGHFEFRVSAHSAASPLALADAVWRWDTRGVEARMIERRLVLSETPTERLVWSLVRPPLVSLRESLIRFTRAEEGQGVVQIDFASVPGASPPGSGGGVRVHVRGRWRFVPDGAGGTLVEHRVVSDPGGGLAPWLVKGAQEDMATALVKEALRRAEQ